MFKRNRVGLAVASLCVVASVGTAAGGAAASTPDNIGQGLVQADAPRAVVTRSATLSTSAKQVDEGNRYRLTAAIKSPRQALRVTLQKFDPPDYSFQDPEWASVKMVKVNARSKVKFGVVAVDENTERYRVVVTYKNAQPFTSKPVGVTVWRWIPLSDYDPYYEAQPYAAGFGTTTINGQAYAGWGAFSYSHVGAWESRFTPGRHCTAFRGILGVGDISADGSSGTIAFTADDTDIYQSPALTPGMSLPVTILLAKPYRFGIRLSDTTPGGTTGNDEVEAWPVIGEPAFRCTGV
jgi:hypothetical protein